MVEEAEEEGEVEVVEVVDQLEHLLHCPRSCHLWCPHHCLHEGKGELRWQHGAWHPAGSFGLGWHCLALLCSSTWNPLLGLPPHLPGTRVRKFNQSLLYLSSDVNCAVKLCRMVSTGTNVQTLRG